MLLRISVVVGGLLAAGCGGPISPEAAYRDYLRALARGTYAEAFDRLTAASRAACVAAESGAKLDASDRPGLRHFRRVVSSGPPHHLPLIPEESADRVEILVESSANDVAVLRITTPAGAVSVTLRREDGAWRIEFKL